MALGSIHKSIRKRGLEKSTKKKSKTPPAVPSAPVLCSSDDDSQPLINQKMAKRKRARRSADGAGPSSASFIPPGVDYMLETMIDNPSAASNSTTQSTVSSAGTAQDFIQFMKTVGGESPPSSFLDVMMLPGIRARGTTVHESDVWSEDRYIPAAGDMEKLIKYCLGSNNQCPAWPTGLDFDGQRLLLLQYFEQAIVYDFAHGFVKSAERARRDCAKQHLYGRMITLLRRQTANAPPHELLSFLRLPSRMRSDCGVRDGISPSNSSEIPNFHQLITNILRPSASSSINSTEAPSIRVDSSVPHGNMFNCRDHERVGQPGGPIPITLFAQQVATGGDPRSGISLASHNSQWSVPYFNSVPPHAVVTDPIEVAEMSQSLNARSMSLLCRLSTSRVLSSPPARSVAPSVPVTSAGNDDGFPVVYSANSTPLSSPHVSASRRGSRAVSSRVLTSIKKVQSWDCGKDPVPPVDGFSALEVAENCRKSEAQSRREVIALERRIKELEELLQSRHPTSCSSTASLVPIKEEPSSSHEGDADGDDEMSSESSHFVTSQAVESGRSDATSVRSSIESVGAYESLSSELTVNTSLDSLADPAWLPDFRDLDAVAEAVRTPRVKTNPIPGLKFKYPPKKKSRASNKYVHEGIKGFLGLCFQSSIYPRCFSSQDSRLSSISSNPCFGCEVFL